MNLREYYHEPSPQRPAVPIARTDYRANAAQLLTVGASTIDATLSRNSQEFLDANWQEPAQ